MSGRQPLWSLSAFELLSLYATREVSPVEVIDSVLERIDEVEPTLHAYRFVNRDGARTAALKAEQAWLSSGDKPPLAGVPVSIKDTIDTADMPTTYGSLAFADHQPAKDSATVKRLRQAGAVLLGKTNTPEFALRGDTWNRLGPESRNPWDPTRTSGGSSGGAAAAVAAGMGTLAIGTDGAGSIRGPAALCGIFGMKPTFGRLPRGGWRGSPLRSHTGPMTRTVRDATLLMNVCAGHEPSDAYSLDEDFRCDIALDAKAIRGKRVAYSTDLGSDLDSEMTSTLGDFVTLLRQFGAEVEEDLPPALLPIPGLSLPGLGQYSPEQYAAAFTISPTFLEERGHLLTTYGKSSMESGRDMPAWVYRLTMERNEVYSHSVREWFKRKHYDFFVCPSALSLASPIPESRDVPTSAQSAPRGGNWSGNFNISKNPAASLPFALHSSGLPLGIQVVGQVGADAALLALAALVESVSPWSQRWPKAFNPDA